MLDDVPTLPCPKHGVAEPPTDLADIAYTCYVQLARDRQFQLRERVVGRKRETDVLLDYQAVDVAVRMACDTSDDQREVFQFIRLIHQTLYPPDEA